MMFIGQIAMGDLAAEPAFEVVEQFGYFGRFKAAVGCPECLLKGLKVFQFWCLVQTIQCPGQVRCMGSLMQKAGQVTDVVRRVVGAYLYLLQLAINAIPF